ncbi:hypothetical protein VR45_31185 [Streptomyces sp. NRRL S-495]|nr:hypothetical protein VR45_31185 [Streptomyces sp. NRRL S-495]
MICSPSSGGSGWLQPAAGPVSARASTWPVELVKSSPAPTNSGESSGRLLTAGSSTVPTTAPVAASRIRRPLAVT